MAITWLLLRGVKESARANNIMVVIKLLVLTLFVVVGAMHIDTSNYVPFAPKCIYTMFGLPGTAWKRFGIWLAIGLVLYFTYGFKHSTLRRGTPPVPITPPA